jgi:hypothetical protein
MGFRLCYTVGVSLSAVSLNTAFVSAYNFLANQIITIINILTRIAVKAAIVYINKKPAIIWLIEKKQINITKQAIVSWVHDIKTSFIGIDNFLFNKNKYGITINSIVTIT